MHKASLIASAIFAATVLQAHARVEVTFKRGCFPDDKCNGELEVECAAKCVAPSVAAQNCSGQPGCRVMNCAGGVLKTCERVQDLNAFECDITNEDEDSSSKYLFLNTVPKGPKKGGFVLLNPDVVSGDFDLNDWIMCAKTDEFTKDALKKYAEITADCAVELNLPDQFGRCHGALNNTQLDKLRTCFENALGEIRDALYNRCEKCALENWNPPSGATPSPCPTTETMPTAEVSTSSTPIPSVEYVFESEEPTPEESIDPTLTPSPTSSTSVSPTPSNLPLCMNVAKVSKTSCSFDRDFCIAPDGSKMLLNCSSITTFGGKPGSMCDCKISSESTITES